MSQSPPRTGLQLRSLITREGELSLSLEEVEIPTPAAHEIVVHCGDSETNAAGRLRYLLAETEPRILGYDQDRWAAVLDYHSLPVEPALAAVEAARKNTMPLLERLTDDRMG